MQNLEKVSTYKYAEKKQVFSGMKSMCDSLYMCIILTFNCDKIHTFVSVCPARAGLCKYKICKCTQFTFKMSPKNQRPFCIANVYAVPFLCQTKYTRWFYLKQLENLVLNNGVCLDNCIGFMVEPCWLLVGYNKVRGRCFMCKIIIIWQENYLSRPAEKTKDGCHIISAMFYLCRLGCHIHIIWIIIISYKWMKVFGCCFTRGVMPAGNVWWASQITHIRTERYRLGVRVNM